MTPTVGASESSDDDGLSAGAIAGITVGAVAAGTGAVAVAGVVGYVV